MDPCAATLVRPTGMLKVLTRPATGGPPGVAGSVMAGWALPIGRVWEGIGAGGEDAGTPRWLRARRCAGERRPSLLCRVHAPSARSSASGGSDDRMQWNVDAAGAVRRPRLGLKNAPTAASCSWSMRAANSANAVTPPAACQAGDHDHRVAGQPAAASSVRQSPSHARTPPSAGRARASAPPRPVAGNASDAPQRHPVRRPAARPGEPRRVHERLRQQHRMPVRRPHVPRQPPQAQPQCPRPRDARFGTRPVHRPLVTTPTVEWPAPNRTRFDGRAVMAGL